MAAFDNDRVSKIGQIMPQFSQVARPGDQVLMGLEGDPMFPTKYRGSNRPTAVIQNVDQEGDEYTVNLKLSDGSTKEVSSMSLSPADVWEFTDDTFQNVVEREKASAQHRAEAELAAQQDTDYRGTNDLSREVQELKNELNAERELNKTFHNTVIDSFREFANDICKLDKNQACQFCHVFNNQYNQMMENRSEASFRGVQQMRDADQESVGSGSNDSDFF